MSFSETMKLSSGGAPSEKDKKKEFYVKKEDLMRELRAYQASKAASPEHKGVISEELRNHDNEDLH